ncbi:hypothetical protein WJX79_008881 [Trebouxia sp. C0005]
MAHVAVLVPCQSGCAEVLPEDVSADEVLQGPLLSAKLNDCRSLHWSAASSNFQVNEIATAAVGFMIHGDVLMTQNTGTGSDLLSEACRDASLQAQLLMQAHLLRQTLQACCHSIKCKSELLGNVLRQMQWTSREAIALTGVCHSWRRVITSDQHFLKGVAVNVNPKAPLRGNQPLCECCRGMSVMVQQARHRQLPLPRVVDKAAHAGNLSACVCVAQIQDARGDTAAALKLWGKAGKLGHPEAQFRLGRACYEGVGVAADAQDALLWLGRATKTLLAEDINVESISNVSTASLLARRTQLHLDRRQAEALKWFKVALLNDCAEAERIIGTLFNTGQYG